MNKKCLTPGKCKRYNSGGNFFPPSLQREGMVEGEEEGVQRKGEGSSKKPSAHFQSAVESRKGSGERMSGGVQKYMESSLGGDFRNVRIHDGSEAAALSSSVQAKAFTYGNDIYFNKGKYAPHETEGKKLLAHELAHVMQQNGNTPGVQRAPDPVQEELKKKAATLEKEIIADPAFKKLKWDSKARVNNIIILARSKPLGEAKGQRNYYLMKLKEAITFPFKGTETGSAEYGCSPEAEIENRKEVEAALKIEERWWEGSGFEDVEENIVATGTKKVPRLGEGGKIFKVDRSDPLNIRVLMKVKLKGKKEEVESIKRLEDAIERNAKTKGYVLDIKFVDTSGPDVFEFTVSFCQWANSGNWASGPVTLSHEVHHALGLDDRYDYIEAHAQNDQMNVPMRLVWFEEQMNKKESDRDPFSKMDTSSNPLLAEDVCAVAFEAGPERKKCIDARKHLDSPLVPPIK